MGCLRSYSVVPKDPSEEQTSCEQGKDDERKSNGKLDRNNAFFADS
jgi:hypothetical protein